MTPWSNIIIVVAILGCVFNALWLSKLAYQFHALQERGAMITSLLGALAMLAVATWAIGSLGQVSR